MDKSMISALSGLAGKSEKKPKAPKAKMHMHIRPTATKGKFIVEHHMRGGDMNEPTMNSAPTEHVMNSVDELKNHVQKHYGGAAAPAAAAPAPAPAAPMPMPGM